MKEQIIADFYKKSEKVLKEVPRFIKHAAGDLEEFDQINYFGSRCYGFKSLLDSTKNEIKLIEDALINQCTDAAWDHALFAMYKLLQIAIASDYLFHNKCKKKEPTND